MTRARRCLAWLAGIIAAIFVLLLVAAGAGPWLLAIAGVWAALFAGAWLISRWTGGRPHYLETWRFEPDETVVWRDDRADVFILTTFARPAIARPLRLHRARVIVTTRCIIVAMSELFTGRQRVVYLLHPGAAPAGADTGPFGGEFKTGYRSLVVQAGIMDVRAGEAMQPSPYIALKPDRSVPSSFNCAEFRIYTDLHESFRLPAPLA